MKEKDLERKEENTMNIPDKPFRFLWYVTKGSGSVKYMWLAVSAVTIAGITNQFISYFLKLVVDSAESGNVEKVWVYGLAFPLVVFFIQSLFRVSGWAGMHWITKVEKYSYDTLTGHTMRHSHGYFTDRFAGSILSKVHNAAQAMGNFASAFLWSHYEAAITFVSSFIIMLFVDVSVALIFVGLLSVIIFVNVRLMFGKMVRAKKSSEAYTRLKGVIVDIFSNVTAVRQYDKANQELQNVSEYSEKAVHARQKSWMYSEKTLILNSVILVVFGLGMFYVLVGRYVAGNISTGGFVFIMAIMSRVIHRLVIIGRIMTDTARTYGEAQEGLTDLLLPYEIKDKSGAGELAVKSGEMKWQNVNFNFEDNQVFKDFSLEIPAGQRVGLVGVSGAGKTTFVSLLLRQYNIDSGSILIDGQDISQVTQSSLRQNIAVVPQEPLLFHRSIRDNIAYGKVDASQEEIETVAKKAQAHDFIVKLSDGYDTLVGERGIKLSGGQKQRVAIARAMLKDAPILVLDEATSALDSDSEVAIQSALHKLMTGKTVVAIAHRLSTLREMDRILVLEEGKIVEDGTHDELSQAGGIYQRLWEHQIRGLLV